jgi:hypothetical protein
VRGLTLVQLLQNSLLDLKEVDRKNLGVKDGVDSDIEVLSPVREVVRGLEASQFLRTQPEEEKRLTRVASVETGS